MAKVNDALARVGTALGFIQPISMPQAPANQAPNMPEGAANAPEGAAPGAGEPHAEHAGRCRR